MLCRTRERLPRVAGKGAGMIPILFLAFPIVVITLVAVGQTQIGHAEPGWERQTRKARR